MLVAHLVRGAVVGAIAALVITGMATLPILALLGAVFGAADALYLPAQQAFLPRTLEPERLPSGNALLQGTMQLSSIVGPPIAGARDRRHQHRVRVRRRLDLVPARRRGHRDDRDADRRPAPGRRR